MFYHLMLWLIERECRFMTILNLDGLRILIGG
jgi:hypothetical protein